MKRFNIALTILLALNLICYTSKGQDTLQQYFKRAESLFNQGKYLPAMPFYSKLVELVPDTLYFKYRLGICYLYKGDAHDKSLDYFLEIQRKKPFAADLNFYLGRAYHVNYQFDKALYYFNLALNEPKIKEDKKAHINQYIKYCNTAKDLMAKASYIEISNIGGPVNTDGIEYAPVVTADENTLIFTYRGERSKGGLQEDEYKDDILISTRKDNSLWSKPVSISLNINTNEGEACIALSPDAQQLFIYKFAPEDQGDIYYSLLKGKSWTKPLKLPGLVNSEFKESSCSMSPGGKTLYFSSKRIGGYGGSDIYKAVFMPDSTWGNIENMGPEINTEMDEDGPFIYPSGTILFYVSNGPKSMGGMDIMQSNLKAGGGWSEPLNLGYPANTVDDDIYYVISAEGNGFFSSSRKGGLGAQDLYIVKPGLIGEKPAVMVVRGIVKIDNLPGPADINVYSEEMHEDVGFYRSNSETGKFLLTLPPGDKYKITYHVDGYKDEIREFSTLGLETYKILDDNINFNKQLLAQLDAMYNAAIKKADQAFNAGDYINAIVFYTEALGYKPNEKYPKDQIEEARRRLIEANKIVIRESVKNFVPGDKDYFTIQIGAFSNKTKADSIARVFRKKKYETYMQYVNFTDKNENWYRVRIGSYKTLEEAKNFAPALLREPLPEGKVWIDTHRIDGLKTAKESYKILQVFDK